MPLLPNELERKYKEQYNLGDYDVSVICADKLDADYYQQLIQHTAHFKSAANWMLGPLKAWCNEGEQSFQQFPLPVEKLGGLINFTETGAVSLQVASTKLLQALIENPAKDAAELASELNLLQEKDSDTMEQWVQETLAAMPDKVKEYRSGIKNLLGLFAGQVKKLSKGKADMQQVTKILEKQLNQ